MMTMISTFLSFLAGGLPKILSIFQDRQHKSQLKKNANWHWLNAG